MTVVVHCLKIWKHYLLGTKFVVVTNNMDNIYFKTQRELTPKQARWQEFLAEFDFDWIHKLGRENAVVDVLSRKYVKEYIVVLSTVETDFGDKIKWESPSDPVYQNLVFVKSKFVVIGWRMTYSLPIVVKHMFQQEGDLGDSYYERLTMLLGLVILELNECGHYCRVASIGQRWKRILKHT